jgi:hypothetical protein
MSEEAAPEHPMALVEREITALAIVPDYRIASLDEATGANEALGKVKSLMKAIAARKDTERRPLNEQLAAISQQYKPAELLLEQAENILKTSLLTFQKAEQKRLEEQRRIEAEAAQRERAQLEEDARKEREKAEAAAEKLREAGKVEQADARLAVAESQARAKETVASLVAAPTKPVEAPKFAGLSTRKKWVAKVVDVPLFLKSLPDTPYPPAEFVTVNQTALNRLAASLQGNMDRVMPGTIAWTEDIVSARST